MLVDGNAFPRNAFVCCTFAREPRHPRKLPGIQLRLLFFLPFGSREKVNLAFDNCEATRKSAPLLRKLSQPPIGYHAQNSHLTQRGSGNKDPEVVGVDVRGRNQESLRAKFNEVVGQKSFQHLFILENHPNPKACQTGTALEEFAF